MRGINDFCRKASHKVAGLQWSACGAEGKRVFLYQSGAVAQRFLRHETAGSNVGNPGLTRGYGAYAYATFYPDAPGLFATGRVIE